MTDTVSTRPTTNPATAERRSWPDNLRVLLVVLVLVATAGRVDGGVPLFGGALLAAGCLVLLARGGGARQLLDRIDSQEW